MASSLSVSDQLIYVLIIFTSSSSSLGSIVIPVCVREGDWYVCLCLYFFFPHSFHDQAISLADDHDDELYWMIQSQDWNSQE